MPSTTVPNIENLNRLIEAIEAESVARFDMSVWTEPDTVEGYVEGEDPPTCGTVACIGGTAGLLSGRSGFVRDNDDSGDYWIVSIVNRDTPNAQEWLELEDSVAEELFFAAGFASQHGISDIEAYSAISKNAAISALKEIRDTGEFKGWDKHVAAHPFYEGGQ